VNASRAYMIKMPFEVKFRGNFGNLLLLLLFFFSFLCKGQDAYLLSFDSSYVKGVTIKRIKKLGHVYLFNVATSSQSIACYSIMRSKPDKKDLKVKKGEKYILQFCNEYPDIYMPNSISFIVEGQSITYDMRQSGYLYRVTNLNGLYLNRDIPIHTK